MIIFHHPARARIKRTKWIQYYKKYISYPYPNKRFFVRTNFLDIPFQSCNFPWEGIPLFKINAQYPSRPTELIRIKCFLGRLIPCVWCLSPKWRFQLYIKYINIYIFTWRRVYLLLIQSSLYCSLGPPFHSDSIMDQVDAQEMNAFEYYSN